MFSWVLYDTLSTLNREELEILFARKKVSALISLECIS